MRVFSREKLKSQIKTRGYPMFALSLRGALDKWYYSDENLMIKEAVFLSDALPYQSHIVESFGSALCYWLGIDAVEQMTCEIADGDDNRIASSYCHDYRKPNEEYVTMTKLLAQHGCDMNEFCRLSGISKISRIEHVFDKSQIINPTGYVKDMCLIDFLLLNPDRHTDNFGILFNIKTSETRIAPLFDFGMGLKAYDRISLAGNIDLEQEIAYQNPFVIPFKDSLAVFKEEWRDTLGGLPSDDIIQGSMSGLSSSRKDLFFRAISKIMG